MWTKAKKHHADEESPTTGSNEGIKVLVVSYYVEKWGLRIFLGVMGTSTLKDTKRAADTRS